MDLAGSSWVAREAAGRPVLVGAMPTASFGHDGRVNGSTGVNRFGATYSLIGDELLVGEIITTRMAGTPEAMAQEQTWLDVLTAACHVRRAGDRLIIEGGGTTLVLVPDAGPTVIEL